MRVLCFSIDIPSHLDWGGYLATAQALQRAGADLWWASGPRVGEAIRQAGLRFVALAGSGWQHEMPPLDPKLPPAVRSAARRRRALSVWLDPAHVLPARDALLAVARDLQPDVLLSEPFAAAGALVAEALHLPLVVVGRPALPPAERQGPGGEAVQQLCRAAGVAGRYWDTARGMPRAPHLHLDFFCRQWYADLPALAPQTVFCGGTTASSARPAHTGRPLIFITLGSTFQRDERFFRLAAETAVLLGARSLVVTGRHNEAILRSLQQAPPARMSLAEWVDYEEAFAQADLVVHHGGVATTHAALRYGVPQIVVPRAGDQLPQAARVTQAGLGYGVRPPQFSYQQAPRLMAQALFNPHIRQRAAQMAASMQALGGVQTAVAAVWRVGEQSAKRRPVAK